MKTLDGSDISSNICVLWNPIANHTPRKWHPHVAIVHGNRIDARAKLPYNWLYQSHMLLTLDNLVWWGHLVQLLLWFQSFTPCVADGYLVTSEPIRYWKLLKRVNINRGANIVSSYKLSCGNRNRIYCFRMPRFIICFAFGAWVVWYMNTDSAVFQDWMDGRMDGWFCCRPLHKLLT